MLMASTLMISNYKNTINVFCRFPKCKCSLAYTVRENIAISNDPEYDENIWSVLDRVGLKEKLQVMKRFKSNNA